MKKLTDNQKIIIDFFKAAHILFTADIKGFNGIAGQVIAHIFENAPPLARLGLNEIAEDQLALEHGYRAGRIDDLTLQQHETLTIVYFSLKDGKNAEGIAAMRRSWPRVCHLPDVAIRNHTQDKTAPVQTQ